MKAADLYLLMKDPSLLTEETLLSLQRIVEEYPYFHIARMLYLKNLAVLNDIRFAAELKKMAVYIPDRRKLFTLIEGERYGIAFQTATEENDTIDSFSLIDAFLAEREKKNTQQEPENHLLFQSGVSADYIYWSLSNDEEAAKEEPTAQLQHQDLIDSFIKEEEERIAAGGLRQPLLGERDAETTPDVEPELEMPHSLDDDSYFTETLAHIYVKQKRYEKALQIIKSLYLNYPEKNSYFADQIRFLEKLIINTKKQE